MNQAAKTEFYSLKSKTMRLHGLIKKLQEEAKGTVNHIEQVSLKTEIEILRKTCERDLNQLQLLGLEFLNKLQYAAVAQAIQKLKKEIE